MISSPVMINPDNGNVDIYPDAVAELGSTGCAVPDVERAIFNSGIKRIWKTDPKTKAPILDENGRKILDYQYPILTTVLYFADGTKTVVTSSEHDTVTFDYNGKPTIESKERGIVYAIMKRIYASVYESTPAGLVLKTEGFGRILKEFVTNAIDQQEEDAAKAAAKAAAKSLPKPTPKAKRPSLGETVVDLSNTIKDLKSTIDVLKADLASDRA